MGCSGSSKVLESKTTRTGDGTRQGTFITKQEDIKIQHNSLVVANKGNISKNYKIVAKIGSGTFGKVYKVIYLPLNQERAMKVVKIDTINYQDDDRTFLKEIEMLMQLDHPNIIKIFEYYRDELNFYVITEIAKGGELYEQIYNLKMYDEATAAVIMKQLLSAVCYIHSKGIVHRDLKPENIMLETNDHGDLSIKLIDFGTSNYFSHHQKLTLKVGTPYYIAPEVLRKDYNNKCDIWSCGIIMYILLSGTPPFDGSDDQAIMDKVKIGKYSLTDGEWYKISFDAKDLLSKMLTYDQNLRISAEVALTHSWFKANSSMPPTTSEDEVRLLKRPFENLRKFNAKQKLQQATIAFLVHHVSSCDMIKDLKKIFRDIDQDGNGTLSYEELKAGFEKYYGDENIGEKEFNEIMSKIDQDKNNCIEYEEFISATINLEKLLTDENLQMAFDAFDKDGSQELTSDEIKEALGLIESDDNHVIKQIISEIDVNGDGRISFDEFKTLMINVLDK